MDDQNPDEPAAVVPLWKRTLSRRNLLLSGYRVGAGAVAAGLAGARNIADGITADRNFKTAYADGPIGRFREISTGSFSKLKRAFEEGGYDGIIVHDSGHNSYVQSEAIKKVIESINTITDRFVEGPVAGKENKEVTKRANPTAWRRARNDTADERYAKVAMENSVEELVRQKHIRTHPTDSHCTENGWILEKALKLGDPTLSDDERIAAFFWEMLIHGGQFSDAVRLCTEERNEHMAEEIARVMKEHPAGKFLFTVGALHLIGEKNVQKYLHEKSHLKFIEIETLAVKQASEANKLYIDDSGNGPPRFLYTVEDKQMGVEVAPNGNAAGLDGMRQYILHSNTRSGQQEVGQ